MQEITKSADPVELVAAPHLEEGAVGEGELVLEAVVNPSTERPATEA